MSNPQNGGSDGVTTEWLKSGNYEVESMGQRHAATLHLKSPFDANNARVKVSGTHSPVAPNVKEISLQGDYSTAPVESTEISAFLDQHRAAMLGDRRGNSSLFQ